ncbi:MAG: efflux transporter outer membrane subunit [Zetaproteobacteria bacterium]|nr:efflux transporter outer membrane subunit [Zetaproteobacteria bacterium]
MRRVMTLFALSGAIGGCMVGSDYSRPSLDVPSTYQHAPNYVQHDARDLADTEWWKQFRDPVLDAMIEEALAHNKELQVAAANVEASMALITQTRSMLMPQLGYQGTGDQKRITESPTTVIAKLIPNPKTTYAVMLASSWEIDFWGRIRRMSEAARASVMASEEARRGVILSLVTSVANTYVQLRSLDFQLATAERTRASYAESVAIFELQFKYGQISQVTLEQARSQYELVAAMIPQIERDIALTENAICLLLGHNPEAVVRGKTLTELALPVVSNGIPSQLLERRPDIAQAEQQLIAANAQIGAARAAYFPTISLTGAYGSASGQLSGLFTGAAGAWNYGGAVAGPIFAGGLVSGQVAQAQAVQQAALYNYEFVIQRAFADVENALISREKVAEQVDAEARRVTALRAYERLAQLQYDGGYADYLTVLNAQQQLFPAEINYAQSLGQKYIALVGVYKSMGGGWVERAEAMTLQTEPNSNVDLRSTVETAR